MLYAVVHSKDDPDDFKVMDQWGDLHTAICSVHKCFNPAVVSLASPSLSGLYCDEHKPEVQDD